jgi:GNAT superfamily N-acetyltransferase
MPDYELCRGTELPFDDVLALYDAVGWTAYTRHPDTLRAALHGSSFVVAARRANELIGLARAISDDASIAYVQDVLVRPDAQRGGVGRALLGAVRERYAHVRQLVLLTDDEPAQRSFYEALGFTEIRDVGSGNLRAFVRLLSV